MNLTAVPAPLNPDSSWSEVLESSYENVGTDPYIVWTTALVDVGSSTIGPSESGEHTSNCPAPSHEDSKPSLRWRQAADGQILFSCRAACEPQIILDALGLSWAQLKWGRTEYIYRSAAREIVGIHVKTPAPNNKKKFWWEHVENGQQFNGRSNTWEQVLWALPDLQEAAARAHEQGRKVHLYLTEGEKDAISVADAFAQNWITNDDDGNTTYLVTTSGDGAAAWSRELSDQVAGLNPARVTIICDSDQAGTTRGTRLIEGLREASPHLTIQALNWLGQASVGDATEAIHLYAKQWLARAIPTAEADIYLWCSAETGWLSEAEALDVDGQPTGKRTLHRTLNPGTPRMRREAIAKWPVRIEALTVDVDGKPVGWEVDLGGGGTALLRTTDLDGSNLEKWNSQAGVFIASTRGLTAALRAYLGFHGSNVGSMTVYDHEGWVDEERFVTRTGLLIGPEGETARASLAGTDSNSADWYYGLGDEAEAIAHTMQILTFRDLTEAGPVLAWLAAVAVRPRALQASGASFVPMLQIPGASGIGKTSFLRLATRLFGFSGNPISNVTSAGLVRTLALTTGVVWIDDFTDYDDTIRDIIRGGITGAGRTRGTTHSERGIVRDEAYAALINSGENAFDANERAMSQRSVILEFARSVQGRASRISPGQDQYRELEALGVARDDKGAGLSRWAGTVIRGLWEAAEAVDATNTGQGSGNGVRGQAAWEFVRYGGHVLAQWLRTSGVAADRVATLERIISEICEKQARNAARRERTGADVYLVQEIVPRYLTTARQQMDGSIIAMTKSLDPDDVKAAIRASWAANYGQGPGMAEQAPRPVVILYPKDSSEFGEIEIAEIIETQPPLAVAISAEALYQWVSGAAGQRAGVGRDERHISATGIAMQLKQVSDKSIHDPGDTSIRVRLGRTSQAPRYRLITEPEVVKWLCE